MSTVHVASSDTRRKYGTSNHYDRAYTTANYLSTADWEPNPNDVKTKGLNTQHDTVILLRQGQAKPAPASYRDKVEHILGFWFTTKGSRKVPRNPILKALNSSAATMKRDCSVSEPL